MAGALQGITVLEFTRVSPGALCTMLLADMGADVLKIETPPAVHATAGSGISPHTAEDAAWSYINRNKRSMSVNLRTPEGQHIVQQLAAQADVLVEGFRPGVMQRLHADYATLSRFNPRLVYCSLSGFGQDGPYRQAPAHDLNYLAMSGVLHLIGTADQAPAIPLNLIADYGGASLHGVIGILFALCARQHTGRGQHVDIAYLDATIALLAATPLMEHIFSAGKFPQRGHGPYTGQYAFYTTYATQDNKLLSVGCTEPWLWANLCHALGCPEFVEDYRRPEHLERGPNTREMHVRESLQSIFRQRPRDAWLALLADKNVCIGPVNTLAEVFDDPHVRHRHMLLEHELPTGKYIRQAGIGLKLSDTPGEVRQRAPYLGQHTQEVLTTLGYSQLEIARFRASNIVS